MLLFRVFHFFSHGLFILIRGEEIVMKAGIHPKYSQTSIKCACGSIIETGCTKQNLKVEICSSCHPFYTGVQKVVDTAGRIEKFEKKYKQKKP